MKNLTRIKVNIFWALILFGLSGCYTIEMANQMTSTPLTPNLGTTTSTIAPESTKVADSATITPKPSPTCHTQMCRDGSTPQPTAIAIIQKQFTNLLGNNGNCELPCFLGITPNETTWEQVLQILRPVDSTHFFNDMYSVGLKTKRRLFSQIMLNDFEDVPLRTGMQIAFDIDENDIVHNIKMGASWFQDGEAEFFDTNFKKYGVREIFQRFGPPDEMYLFRSYYGYNLNLVYRVHKFVIYYGGNFDYNLGGQQILCPNIGDGQVTSLTLGISDAENPVDWTSIMGIPVDIESPLEELSGVNNQDFYELMTSDERPACVELKEYKGPD